MQQIEIGENEAGQRLDKFLQKFMPLAPSSFFYKMLRKKNITLNGKKAEGKEKLALGDKISFYLADETIAGFCDKPGKGETINEYQAAYRKFKEITVVYEDAHVIIMNKPKGILSQKANPDDISLNEWMLGYLLEKGSLKENQLSTFKPSICNRLDRNTSGLVIGAKSLQGSQLMNELIRSRGVRKFYRMFVKGKIVGEETLEGFLIKDQKSNKVHLVKEGTDRGAYIKTRYYPVREFKDRTLVEAELITGKPHQIRIHMASIGHPLLGDYKYGDRDFNDSYKKQFSLDSQMLHAYRLNFPKLETPLEQLSEKVVEAPLPEEFQQLTEG